MTAINNEFIKRTVVAGLLRSYSDEAVDEAIVDATHILGNLVHYTSGRNYYNEDIAYIARLILASRWRVNDD